MLHALDVIVGLTAVYTAFSLLASWVQEQIAAIFKLRAATLKAGLIQMIGDVKTHASLFGQPSMIGARTPGSSNPSYISPHQFSMAVLGMVNAGSAAASTGAAAFAQIVNGVNGMPASRFKDGLLALAGAADGEINTFVSGVEKWFDDEMDRVTGWYKRNVQVILLVVGAAIAALFNVDTLRLAHNFLSRPLAMDASKMSGPSEQAEQYVSQMVFSSVTLGWPDTAYCPGTSGDTAALACQEPQKWWSVLSKILGLLLTAVALSLGAPFWFDTLSRFVNVRNSGPPPDKSTAEDS